MYQDNLRRESFRAQAPSLRDFVSGLMLRVEIGDATEEQVSRVSQLTYRTNQFNFTSIRRSPSEIRSFLKRENAGGLTVRVSDRFGDYGLVGVVLYEVADSQFTLDTFLLSCRVLGRGVEHKIMSSIGKRALDAGKKFVEITCIAAERNLPAWDFVQGLGSNYRRRSQIWLFPADYLAKLQYNPDEGARQTDEPETLDVGKTSRVPASGFSISARPEHLQRIGEELYDISQVAKAIDTFRLISKSVSTTDFIEPSSDLETKVLNIWTKVLCRSGIGLDNNFFEVGGSSLKAVQIISMIRKELNKHLSITSLFECPTVRLLAAKMSASAEKHFVEPRRGEAALRGQQRRTRALSRTRVS